MSSTKKYGNVDNFYNKIFYSPCGCWYWLGATYPNGYGQITFNKQHKTTHRFSYQLHKGEIKNKLCVLHSCDNRLCVNPSHLWLGTHKQNTLDMIIKGRKYVAYGEDVLTSKLKTTEVIDIRSSYANGVALSELAIKFKITERYAADLIRKKYWKHL